VVYVVVFVWVLQKVTVIATHRPHYRSCFPCIPFGKGHLFLSLDPRREGGGIPGCFGKISKLQRHLHWSNLGLLLTEPGCTLPWNEMGMWFHKSCEAKSCVVTRVLCGRQFCGVTSFFRVRTCVRPQIVCGHELCGATTCGWATRCVGLRVAWPRSCVGPPVVAGHNLLGPTRSVTERVALCGSTSCVGP